MTRGILFYNYGTGCAARMAVAIHTLRQHYTGPITILADDEEAWPICLNFAQDARLNVSVVRVKFNVAKSKNHHYLSKCRLHEYTPYDVTLFLDSDTITLGDLTPLLDEAEKHEFVTTQFSNWKSNGRIIQKRIEGWKRILPNDMEAAINFGPAINTGVMAFTRTSKFMTNWFRYARRGRHLFIPDEVSAQVLLHRYPHWIAPYYYNASCKYDDCHNPDVRLIHFHGKKHCRTGLPYHGSMWAACYERVFAENIADIQEWTPAGDIKLKAHIDDTYAAKSS